VVVTVMSVPALGPGAMVMAVGAVMPRLGVMRGSFAVPGEFVGGLLVFVFRHLRSPFARPRPVCREKPPPSEGDSRG
jgi:hypothetical protein